MNLWKNIQIRITFFVFILCCIPFGLNLLGFDFSSDTVPFSSLTFAHGEITVEDFFHVLKGASHHALLEWSAVCVALIAALSYFLHYSVRRDVTVPVIGMALVCAGFVDTFHTLAAMRLIQAEAPNMDFIPFTWALSRIFNASIIIIGASISLWITRQSVERAGVTREKITRLHSLSTLLFISVIFIVIAYSVVHWAAVSAELPKTMYPNALVTRPFDLLPLALFLFGGTLFSIWYRQKPSIIKFALILSIIPEVATQLHMTFGSVALFDNHFNIAHALKVFAYSIVLIGVLLDLVKNTSVHKAEGAIFETGKRYFDFKGKAQKDMLDVGKASRPMGVLIPTAAFLLALSVALVISFSFYLESVRLVHKQEIEDLKIESNLISSMLRQLYQQASSDVVFLSRTPPVQGMLNAKKEQSPNEYEAWKSRLTQTLSEMLLTKPIYQGARYVGVADGGFELINVIHNIGGVQSVPDSRLKRTLLEQDFRDALTLNPGDVHFSLKNKSFNSHTPSTAHNLFAQVVTPIYDQGTVFGYVILDFDFGEFIHHLVERNLSGVSFYLANPQGDLLFHTEDDVETHEKEVHSLQEIYPALSDVLGNDINQKSFPELSNAHDETSASFLRVIDFDQFGSDESIVLLLQHDKKKISSELESFRNRSLLLGVSMALVALALAVVASRRISSPIVAMTNAVETYEHTGRLEKLPIKSKDEMGVLARSFNNLILRIDDAIYAQSLAADQANELSDRLQSILDSAADAIITIDSEGLVLSVNKAATNMFGYAEDEIVGERINMLMPSAYAEVHDQYLKAYGQTGRKNIIDAGRELQAMKKTGEIFDIHLAVSEVETTEGKIFTGLIRDITTSKEAEKALIEGKQAAENADRYKSEFLASMSHEIRTPMNGVLGMLGLVQKSDLTDDQRHRIELAKSSGESLLTLINDILDFSKVEAGKLELEILDFNLRSTLGEFSESIAHKAQEKGLEMILDVTLVQQSMVKGDPGRIRQILTNLVGNAIKFTEEGEIVVRAELIEERDGSLLLYCSVEDTGIGIPLDKVDNLFDSFTQVDASTTRKYGGTGLGLAISKQLCELMGGGIEVISGVGRGSTFQFHIKLEASKQSCLVLPHADIKGAPILIVDDNTTNRAVLRGQLEHWGADVVEASSGNEALEMLNARYQDTESLMFTVAFLDMQMPEMDGAELGALIRAENHFDPTKLVMMTSMSTRGDAKRFADIGFSAYFPKPTTTSDLFDALSVVLEGGEALEKALPLVTHHYLQELDHTDANGEIEVDQDVVNDTESTSIITALVDSEQEPVINWPQNARILLVEDNYINQAVATGILEGMGLTCDVAGNGLEALSSLVQAPDNAPYTLILMDCQMPELDGYEATQRIRNGDGSEHYRDLTIVAMTANAMKGDKEKCINAGMNDYLSKPINAEALKGMLVKWLINSDERIS